jgi:hypothetical protein
MLINLEKHIRNHVKFISYTGKYPILCAGILTLEIDGEPVTFGYSRENKPQYPPFWHSGGCTGDDETIITGEWRIDISALPEQYKKYAVEIDEVFNQNVEHGCCGGCI